jgi:hypothetical protein
MPLCIILRLTEQGSLTNAPFQLSWAAYLIENRLCISVAHSGTLHRFKRRYNEIDT